jgi:hypothetical protein
MPEPAAMKSVNLGLVLAPQGIELDAAGRIRFVNPEILQAVLMARPADEQGDGGTPTNVHQCSCNPYQCGK